jgi:hypothetical protein
MNLDFTLLSRPASAQPMHKSWGQAGTVGTQAFMRVPAPPGGGDTKGTGGDNSATTHLNIGMVDGAGDLPSVPCPQVSPPCPRSPTARKTSIHAVSPVSPLVPRVVMRSRSGDDFDREAFEERAAIMKFYGGMTRADAEAAALALLSAAG